MNHSEVGWKQLNGRVVINDNLMDCWKECRKIAKVEELKAEINEFNK